MVVLGSVGVSGVIYIIYIYTYAIWWWSWFLKATMLHFVGNVV